MRCWPSLRPRTHDGSDIAAERPSGVQAAYRDATARVNDSEIPWVMCWYPTPALAQDAGMTTREFEHFLYGACLLDWDAERERMQRHASAFDGAEQVRPAAQRGATGRVLLTCGRSS